MWAVKERVWLNPERLQVSTSLETGLPFMPSGRQRLNELLNENASNRLGLTVQIWQKNTGEDTPDATREDAMNG